MKPTVIQKKGKTYVKIGRSLIRVDRQISERELIQWMIKQFYGKHGHARVQRKHGRRKQQKKIEQIKFIPTGFANDNLRGDLRKLDEKNTKLEHELTKLQLKESEQLKEPERPQIKSSKGITVSDEQVEQLREAWQQQQDELAKAQQLKEQLALELEEQKEQTEAEIKAQKEQAEKAKAKAKKAEAESRKALEDKLADEEQKRKNAEKNFYLNRYSFNELRNKLKGHGQDQNPDHDSLIKLGKQKENVFNNPEIKAELEAHLAKYDTGIAKIKADLEQLEQQGEGDVTGKDEQASRSKGTSDSELNRIMSKYKQFLGVFAADEMNLVKPLANYKRFCWIMNTDPRSKPGQHWVAFFIDVRPHGSHSVEYYDPLADPIKPEWFVGLKALLRRLGYGTYARFKDNAIADQNDTSSNCGEFCCHFLIQRLKGETFARATGWDAEGEKNIEKWKRKSPDATFLWLSGQQGEGLRDIYERVRSSATKVIQRIKDTLGGPRNGPSPAVRGWLEKYGNLPIKEMTVCKKPVYSWIERIGNWVTQGKMRENMDRLGYEQMMHLYLIVELENGPTVKIEKNQIVEIKQSSDLGRQWMDAGEAGSTVKARFEAAEKIHGAKLWQYHLVTQNCQKFVLWFLDNPTQKVREFVEQDVGETLKDMGLLQKIATAVTDIAATADVALNGRGD